MFRYVVKTPWWLKAVMPPRLVWTMPAEREPAVYITFDDGPHPQITPFVLDQLRQYQAHATFFCVGDNVKKFSNTYEAVIREGHSVGNHTFNHLNGWKTGNDKYLDNINLAGQYISSNLFRPPYGRIKRSQAAAMKRQRDWKIIMWDVLSADFDRDISPQKCVSNVIGNLQPGSIVLFHDSEKTWDRMSFALPRVLEHCSSKGWAIKAIPYTSRD